jgi:hypothetical protein
LSNVLYYEKNVSEKATFSNAMTKNAYIHSIFNHLSEKERIKYILKTIKKWNEFLDSNPNIIENQIPTLHLLLEKSDDILLYFTSLGLSPRSPINRLLFYNHEKEETGSQQYWSDLSQTKKDEYGQRLCDLKNEYYQKLVEFVDHILQSDYMIYEFFLNIKYAIKDYDLAIKDHIIDKKYWTIKYYLILYTTKKAINNDINQLNQIKQRFLSTELTNEQRNLVEELTHLLYKCIE